MPPPLGSLRVGPDRPACSPTVTAVFTECHNGLSPAPSRCHAAVSLTILPRLFPHSVVLSSSPQSFRLSRGEVCDRIPAGTRWPPFPAADGVGWRGGISQSDTVPEIELWGQRAH